MEIETSEQLAWYVDTLKMLFSTAHREHNEAAKTFVRRFMDGLVPQAAMLALVQDDSTRKIPTTASERRLEHVATALVQPAAPLPPDGSGGAKVPNPEPPKPLSPPDMKREAIQW